MNMDVSGNGRQQRYPAYPSSKSNQTSKSCGHEKSKTQPAHPSVYLADHQARLELHRSGQPHLLLDREIETLVGDVPLPIPGVFGALNHLKNAKNTALKCDKNHELFAVGLDELTDRGLLIYQLRWLDLHQLIARCRHRNWSGGIDAVFETVVGSHEDAYIITINGERFLDLLSAKIETQEIRQRVGGNRRCPTGFLKPLYNSDKHLLIYEDSVVKRFRWAAANQERVLMAFQEEGWPRRIDDPLLPDAEICPKRRLHDTIKCLNRRQENRVLRFRGDGTGTGVLWEVWNQSESFTLTG